MTRHSYFPAFNFMIFTVYVSVFTVLTSVMHVMSVSAVDFRHTPLSAEKQGELDALVARLGSPSAQIREQAGRDIMKFGDSATETLQKALENRDYTISNSARYYLQLLNPGLLRYNDSDKVREILTAYSTFSDSRRAGALYALTLLPPDEALPPLLRIVMHETNVTYARAAAVAVMWNLPCTRIYPEWSQPIPEVLPKYPNPERWREQNQEALAKREKLQAEIRQYLESEPEKTVGKTLLLELFALEYKLRENSAQTAEANLAQKESWARLAELETEFYEEISENPLPEAAEFLKDFTYFASDLLCQVGNVDMGKEYFSQAITQYNIPLKVYQYSQENGRILSILTQYQNIQRLAARGHWEWASHEIYLLNESLNTAEKRRLSSYFVSTLRSIGEYELSIDILKKLRQISFLNSDDSKSLTAQYTAQIQYYRILEECKKSNYTAAWKIIDEMLEKREIDIDALILARKLALYQKDAERENTINLRIDAELEQLKDKIENPLRFHEEKEQVAQHCNTFAWLAGNTNRQLDEALLYAEKSLTLRPDTPGVMDTLATVHFARGEKEKALEIQRKAHQEAPNELDILQNLHRFEATE